PKVLLMDEPFGALDAQTRETMQAELLELHARTRKTILFVTHDLDEAVLIADRIVVMKHGMVQEIMTVPLGRPRPDLGIVRGTPEFADTRYRVWKALHEPAAALHWSGLSAMVAETARMLRRRRDCWRRFRVAGECFGALRRERSDG